MVKLNRNTIIGLLAVQALPVIADGECYSSVTIAKSMGTYTWQTSSYCISECSDYPYIALKNGNECYCLNEKPSGSTISSSNCNKQCTGFGQDTCGGANAYQVYKGTGSGVSSSDSASATDSSDASSTLSSNDQSSSTEASTTSSTDSSTSSSASSAATATSSSASASSSSSAAATTTSSTSSSDSDEDTSSTTKLVTATSSGSGTVTVVTKTATPSSSSTSSSSSDDDDDSSSHKKGGFNTAAIAGGVVGGIAGAVLLGFLAFFFIRYRKNNEESEDEEEYYDKPAGGVLRGSSNKSKVASPLDMPMSNPFTDPTEANIAAGGAKKSDLVDPRLNPIMMGRRRLSEGSLADEADYSRKILQVVNPDS